MTSRTSTLQLQATGELLSNNNSINLLKCLTTAKIPITGKNWETRCEKEYKYRKAHKEVLIIR
jgi:hypothetical protein